MNFLWKEYFFVFGKKLKNCLHQLCITCSPFVHRDLLFPSKNREITDDFNTFPFSGCFIRCFEGVFPIFAPLIPAGKWYMMSSCHKHISQKRESDPGRTDFYAEAAQPAEGVS